MQHSQINKPETLFKKQSFKNRGNQHKKFGMELKTYNLQAVW